MTATYEAQLEELDRQRRTEKLRRIVEGEACPAKRSSRDNHGFLICGDEPAEHGAGLGNLDSLCAYHLRRVEMWSAEHQSRLRAENARQVAERQQADQDERDARSVVYFLSLPHERVKIGFSSQFDKRLMQHRRYFGADTEVLLTVKGARHAESAIHAKFRHLLVAGEREVFHATPELIDWIDRQADKQTERAA